MVTNQPPPPSSEGWEEYDRLRQLPWNASLEIVAVVDAAKAASDCQIAELQAEHALLIEHYNQGERLWGEAQIELLELRASVDRLTKALQQIVLGGIDIYKAMSIAEVALRQREK